MAVLLKHKADPNKGIPSEIVMPKIHVRTRCLSLPLPPPFLALVMPKIHVRTLPFLDRSRPFPLALSAGLGGHDGADDRDPAVRGHDGAVGRAGADAGRGEPCGVTAAHPCGESDCNCKRKRLQAGGDLSQTDVEGMTAYDKSMCPVIGATAIGGSP